MLSMLIELQFVAFDPTKFDQFVAIRSDKTWQGAIDDSNSEALEAFASSFFEKRPPPGKPSAQRRPSHCNPGQSRNLAITPTPAAQAHYETWSTYCATLFAAATAARATPKSPSRRGPRSAVSPTNISSPSNPPHPSLITSFPHLPPAFVACKLPSCILTKSVASGLRACKHDVKALFLGSGLYSYEWLRQERLRWHPDRFGRLCAESFREEGKRKAEEMWKICEELMVIEKNSAESRRMGNEII